MARYKILLASVLMALCIGASAQVPAFREKGFKGSVGVCGTFDGIGIPLSNGYMFNENHYLGGGLGVYFQCYNFVEHIFEAFLEYQYYILKRNSTPVVGAKLTNVFTHDIELPYNINYGYLNAGWSWGIGKYGLTLQAGWGVDVAWYREEEGKTSANLDNVSLQLLFEF